MVFRGTSDSEVTEKKVQNIIIAISSVAAYLQHKLQYYGAVLSMKKSANGTYINPDGLYSEEATVPFKKITMQKKLQCITALFPIFLLYARR
jgi:hypothetical protein